MTRNRNPKISSDYPRAVFIVGVSTKVGTTYLSRLLTLHPRCVGFPFGEDHLLKRMPLLRAFTDSTSQFYESVQEPWGLNPGQVWRWDPLLKRELGLGILRTAHRIASEAPEDDRMLVMKTPGTAGLEQFPGFFPHTPLIILTRDGKTSADSRARWHGIAFDDAVGSWVAGARDILRFTESSENSGVRYLIVRYENLVTSLRAEVRRIFRFLDLPCGLYDWSAATNLPVTQSSFKEGREDFAPLSRHVGWSEDKRVRYDELVGEWAGRLGY